MLPIGQLKMWLDHLQTIHEIARKELPRLLKQGAKRKFKQQIPGRVRTNVVYAMLHTKTSQMNRNIGLAVN